MRQPNRDLIRDPIDPEVAITADDGRVAPQVRFRPAEDADAEWQHLGWMHPDDLRFDGDASTEQPPADHGDGSGTGGREEGEGA